MADVIAFADDCTQDDWRTLCPGEERTVGVLFDHIAVGNDEAVVWVKTVSNCVARSSAALIRLHDMPLRPSGFD